MFKLSLSPTFYAPVDMEFTREDGTRAVARFDAKFRRLSREELLDLQRRIREQELEDVQVVREMMVGWRGIEGDDGGEAEFNEENLDKLLNLGAGVAIVTAFFQNAPKAKLKN